ncbi:MAG: hypothetical protein SNH01_06360 [Rikenellaceae bacterium]
MKKKILSICAIMLLAVTATMAQPKDVTTMAKNKVAAMDKVIDLTPEQEAKMLPIYEEESKASQAIMKLENGSEEKKAAIKSRYQNFNKASRQVLTPEQMTKWQAYVKEKYGKK